MEMMATKKFVGGCHCGLVRYTVELDLAANTTRCNCTYCTKVRAWTTAVKPAAFHLISDGQALVRYHKDEQAPVKHFCRQCGVVTHGSGDADYMGGPFVAVYIATLDDACPEELAGSPVRFCNGRDNLWWEPPAVTSYL